MDAAAGSTAAAVAFDVTDTFTLTVRDGRIVAVRTRSDDPEPVRAAFRRLFAEQPALPRRLRAGGGRRVPGASRAKAGG